MEACCKDAHLRWASRLLGLAGFLLGVCGAGPMSSGGADSRADVSLERVQGGSVWFNVTRKLEGDPEAQPQHLEWRFGPETTYRVFLQVGSGGDPLTWVSLQDKYEHRVRVPSMTSLLIQNLTREDSGQYRARASFTGGRGFTQVFQLSVYERVPLPQIQATSLSVTADWCNATLECRAKGATENLNVTWWHSDVPRKWRQRGTLGPGSSAWPLAVSLPLDQLNTSFTCAVSNQVDRKTATTTLGDICARYSQGQATGRHVAGIAGALMVVLLTVGAGLYFCKKRGKKKEMEAGTGRLHISFRPNPSPPHGALCPFVPFSLHGGGVAVALAFMVEGVCRVLRLRVELYFVCDSGAGLEDGHRVREDGICYAELSQQVSQEGGDKGVREQPLEGKIPVTTIYSEVHRPGQAAKVI